MRPRFDDLCSNVRRDHHSIRQEQRSDINNNKIKPNDNDPVVTENNQVKPKVNTIKTIGWPLDRCKLTTATQSPSICFCTLWHCDLWPFDLILIGGWGLVMDYPRGKFGDCSFSRFGCIVRTGQTHTHTHTQTPLNALLPRLSSAWVISLQPSINEK